MIAPQEAGPDTRESAVHVGHERSGGVRQVRDQEIGSPDAFAERLAGAGVASAVNLLDVEAVVIGGGLGVRFGQPFAGRIAQAMHPHLFKDNTPPDVHVAALGEDPVRFFRPTDSFD